jgi:outer membrane protein OmpA-like peptidoglycan-associated protein
MVRMASGSRNIQRTRLLVQRERPVWPFFWRGLLPLLGLLLVFGYALWPFARTGIEAQVDASVRQTMLANGWPDVRVLTSGQQVLLSGSVPEGVTTPQVLAAAQKAACATWLIPMTCPELVLGQFETLSIGLPSAPAAAASLPDVAVAPPSIQEQQACEAALASIVQAQRISFASASAQLEPDSKPVLDRIAKAHEGCKGIVRIEGHTDSSGDEAANQQLSAARAESVRQALIERGIAANRLVAEGFGESRPVADNATAEGRQQNRRIDFKVVVPE